MYDYDHKCASKLTHFLYTLNKNQYCHDEEKYMFILFFSTLCLKKQDSYIVTFINEQNIICQITLYFLRN